MSKNIIVIGAGAAGLVAAIIAARGGAKVTLLERLDEPGRKILATGGGRCNISTSHQPAEYLVHFPEKTARFIRPAIYAMDVAAIQEFFTSIRVPTDSPEPHKIFPVSQKAKDVRDALVGECRRLGVNIWCNIQCHKLIVAGGTVRGVMCTDTAGERELFADRVIISAGGQSMDTLGSDGSGFTLAKDTGHRIIPPCPALVPLNTVEQWPGELAGLSVSGCRVGVEVDGRVTMQRGGDVLFTHKGLSGPAVLDCSGEVCAALAGSKKVALLVKLLPSGDNTVTAFTAGTFSDWRQKHGAVAVVSLLGKIVASRLAHKICELCGMTAQTTAATAPGESVKMLERMLNGCRFEIRKSEGFSKSYATRGGVSLKDVDGKTLQSRRVQGLYFAGEVLDVDAPCGGYNLQWAWASGRLAAESALSMGSN